MSSQISLPKDLTPEEKRQLLSKLLERRATGESNRYPLSYAQQAMWFLYELAPESSAYNTGFAARIAGELDLPLFKESFQALLNWHPCLRTTFTAESGTLVQEVSADQELHFQEIDANGWDEVVLFDRVMQALRKPFDLKQGPMLRVDLFTVSPTERVFLVSVHHIVIDGRSVRLLLNDFLTVYNAKRSGTALSQPQPREQFASYVKWEKDLVHSPAGERHGAYWLGQLAGELPVLNLATDCPRPPVQRYEGATQSFTIDRQLTQQLRALARGNSLTLYMLLLAAFQTLLYRYTHQDDFIVGSAVTETGQAGFAEIVGYMVNVVALRANIPDGLTFKQLLSQTRQTVLEMLEHKDFPFPLLVERLNPERDPSRNPIYQVLFDLQRIQTTDPMAALLNPEKEHNHIKLSGLTLNPFWIPVQEGLVDLSLQIVETDEVLWGSIKYNTDLFAPSTIRRMSQHLLTLLAGVVTNPDEQISLLPLLTSEEQQLIAAWNNTEAEYPKEKCIHELFEEQVERTPDALAVVFEDLQLTYRELNAKSNQLAYHLRSLEVGPETLVGLCVNRSVEMIVGLLGILKAGGAYLPLDPTYPQERLSYMLDDSQALILLTQSDLRPIFPNHSARAVSLDTEWEAISRQPRTSPPVTTMVENLAYVIYTSGSTGKPKGVSLTHRGLVNVSEAQIRAFDLGTGDHVLQFSSLSFDASTFEIFLALRTGATLFLGIRESLLPGEPLANFINDNSISIVTLPPSVLALLPSEDFPSLRTINVAGEACSSELVSRWAVNRRFNNLYGPTETTIWATMSECTDSGKRPTIGHPIPNVRVYVLDASQQPVPIGVPGELHIGGVGLARGYLNRPELTAEKFITNPFSITSGDVLYKTGDLVRYLENGELEFLGRIDHQVKIRGFRVELGEIESILEEHPAVLDAEVIVREQETIGKQIVAYIVPRQENDALRSELQLTLKDKLPEHMLPAAIVMLKRLPLTPSGKVDRKALPEPDLSSQQAMYIPPRTRIEKALCQIWQELLGIERVGITDNFFHLGGHSLLATRLASRINKQFDVALPLKTVFAEQTLEHLARAIRRLDTGVHSPPLVRVPREERLLPSYAQQRLWLLDQIDGGSAHYHISGGLRLSGELDLAAMNRAFTTIIQRHESLRTCFAVGEDGQPYQIIQAVDQFVVAIQDLSGLTDDVRLSAISDIIDQEAHRLFDLRTDLMLRVQLLKLTATEHILLVTMHHIASDGWSITILINEFNALYSAYTRGRENPLPPLEIQYVDYAHWQRNWLQGEVLEQQLHYWEGQLTGLPLVHSLPLDHPRPKVQSFVGHYHRSQIDADTTNALNTLCQAQGATLFMGLHAAFSTLLARYGNELDIVIGSPIANREQAEIAGLIGFFVNTLVLRSNLSDNPSFVKLLDQSKHTLLDAYAHQQIPFEQIVERLQPERSLSHSPLFQVMLVLQNNEQGSLSLPGLTLSPMEQTGATLAKFDLTLYVSEGSDGLQLDWEYNTDLFESSTIQQMAEHFQLLVNSLLQAPQESVFKASMLSDAERHRLLVEWNDTALEYPQDKCVHQLFEEQVERTPEAIAVVFENQQLSYRELNTKANQLAHYLRKLGVKAETPVGISMERSAEMIIGLLGILKAGGAYIPLDPHFPQNRLAYMLENSEARILVTQERTGSRTTKNDKLLSVNLDSDWHMISQHPIENLPVNTQRNNLAYIIFTSGSTGRPKGVQIPHQAVVNFLTSMRQKPGLSENDQLLSVTTLSFDISVLEVLLPLSVGARVIVAPGEAVYNAQALIQELAGNSITVMQATPATWQMLIDGGWQGDKNLNVLCGGEAMSQELAKWLTKNVRAVWNMYGPTETTVWSTVCEITSATKVITIGNPIGNTQTYILDKNLEPVPVGVIGELYIGGDGVAKGYLKQLELTTEKFLLDPFAGKTNARMYRTGDQARYLADGQMDYLGRVDFQVKIRGFRIELGEIENVLNSHERVKNAVVVTRESANGEKYLVAYIVTESLEHLGEGTTSTIAQLIEQLRSHLSQSFPEYMIPAAFMVLDKLPLTPNGKVDRKALPKPDFSSRQAVYTAPRTETEKVLCGIWQEVLGIERVGITDNFFQLGGHSLLATRVASRIRQNLHVELPLRTLFEAPTPLDLDQQIKILLRIKQDRSQSVSMHNSDDREEIQL